MSFDTSGKLLKKMMTSSGEGFLMSFLSDHQFSYLEHYHLYVHATSLELYGVAKELLKRPDLRDRFNFLGDLVDKWIEESNFKNLEYPVFVSKGLTLREVIEDLIQDKCNRYVFKEFCKLVCIHGTRVLNNYRVMKSIYRKKSFSLHEFFQLDHTKSYELLNPLESFYMEPILRQYSPRRSSRLMDSMTNEIVEEFSDLMIGMDPEEKDNLAKLLPRKPRNLQDIKKYMESEMTKLCPPETPLNQSLIEFNSCEVKGYQILIPQTVRELVELSRTFENCLHRYPRKILKKKCQVVVLSKGNSPQVVVELKEEAGRFKITQFLGYKNDSYLQGIRGKPIREELEKLVNSDF